MNDDFTALLEKARSGDIKARNIIIEGCQHIIDGVCKQLYRIRCDESAKRYGALIGVIHAIRKYDGVRAWEPYVARCAYTKAINEISGEYLVSKPRYKIQQYLKEERHLHDTVGLGEFFADTGCILHSVEDDEESHVMLIKELITHVEMPETACLETLNKCLFGLTELERDAILHKYRHDNESLKKLGKKHGVSHEWIRLKADKTFKKVKREFFKQIKPKGNIWDTKSS